MRIIRLFRGERSQAVLEFAFIAPFLLLFIFILVDTGLGLSRWINVTNAAREGARYGVVGHSYSEIVCRTIAKSEGLLGDADTCALSSKARVKVNWEDANTNGVLGDGGDSVMVQVEYDYALITPIGSLLKLFGGSGISANIPLESCADMRLDAGAPVDVRDNIRCN